MKYKKWKCICRSFDEAFKFHKAEIMDRASNILGYVGYAEDDEGLYQSVYDRWYQFNWEYRGVDDYYDWIYKAYKARLYSKSDKRQYRRKKKVTSWADWRLWEKNMHRLTERENKIMEFWFVGFRGKELADILGLTMGSVRARKAKILNKLNK